MLAPTEVLAAQHYRGITAMLGDLAKGGMLGGADGATRVRLLTGSQGAKARKESLLDAASGEAGIVIGTHALIQDHVQFAELGLLVVDEQHRFGVEQRAALVDRAEVTPHVLVMTATPIPRTIAMSVFGDLEVSTLRELPAGRQPIQTTVVPYAERPQWLDRGWERVREEVGRGRQAYVVVSRIGEGDDGGEKDTRSLLELREELEGGALHGLRLGSLHGRMTPDDKDAAMNAFAARRDRRARRHDGRRGRRRRPQCNGHGRHGCRPVRHVAAAPAARPRRSRLRGGSVPAGHRIGGRLAGP